MLVYREGELADEILFLNRDRNGRQVEYLSYTTGRTERDMSTAAALATLLGRVTGREVAEEQVLALAERSLAETPSVETLLGPPPQVGKVRGDYEILAEIGRGGMGVVFLARQLSLGRLVALKMLPSDLTGDEVALARFRREMRVLARCEHPNIVKVLASGTMPEGDLFYAMEYVPGCDLEQVWKELSGSEEEAGVSLLGELTWAKAVLLASRKRREEASKTSVDDATLPISPLPPLPELPPVPDDPGGYVRRVAGLIRDAALALQAVHDQQVIHRDIKPANLMLTPDGNRIVLMDFGLAKGQSLSMTASKGGGLLGTLRYAAPEQLAAASLKVGPAADVRGLGVTLWEMLTRRRVFAEADDERSLAAMVFDVNVPRLRSVDPAYDRDLEAICARATERRTADRISSPGKLAEYLQLYLNGKPLPIRPLTARELLLRWVRDHRPAVSAIVATLTVIVGSSSAAFYLVNRSRDRAVAALADSEANAYFHTIALAVEAKRSRGVGDAEALLESCPARLRGWEWHYLRNQCVRPLLSIPQHRDEVNAVTFSPDGEMGASASAATYGHSQVMVWDARSGVVIAEFKGHESSVNAVAFSPNSRFVASYDLDNVAIWEAKSGKLVKTIGDWRGTVNFDDAGRPERPRDGDQPSRWDRDWIVWRQGYDLILRTPDDARPFALGPTLNPVSGQFAIRHDESIDIYDADRKKRYAVESDFRNPFNRLSSADFSPDGSKFVALSSAMEPIRGSGSMSRTFAHPNLGIGDG